MEYPIWQLTTTAGGFWVALISVVHVYVAQFAVGGGLFLVLTEHSAYRQQSDELLEYVKKHSKFFLLLTMVFGAVTGVGIWFTIALTAPQATIVLIHNFLFAWATEWTFFLGEIISLLVYFYGWNRLTRSQHLTVGWFYFTFGWLSLFMINGILGFMLTPGEWLETRDFWDGFFNPSFWPQLFFRTFICLMLAGLFGFVTATRIENDTVRAQQVRNCSIWTLAGVLLMFACGYWYFHAMPSAQFELIAGKSHRVSDFLYAFWIFGPLVLVGGLLLGFRMSRTISFPLALLVLVVGLGLTGSFEFMREAGRKPYLIWGHIYSNSILKSQVPAINNEGILKRAKWVRPELRTLTEENALQAGEWIYQLECSSCHSINGPLNDIMPRTAKFTTEGMDAFLTGMGTLNPYMPPFIGTEGERKALAAYVTQVLHKKKKAAPEQEIRERTLKIPPFDAAKDEYVLLAWARQGLRFVSDTTRWTLQPPGSILRAQLFKRDVLPESVEENVRITFTVEDTYPPAGLSGTLTFVEQGYFEASNIPVMPYETDGGYNPFPVFTVTAEDSTSGEVLAQTKVVLPADTKMGCMNCHGATWKHEEARTGIAEVVADDVLAVHDRRSGTRLAKDAAAGKSIDCRSCHTAKKGHDDRGALNLSASMHGFHAPYLADRESDACGMCHPRELQRDPHLEADITCVSCHGPLENHALSLLKAEKKAGKEFAETIIRNIIPRDIDMAGIEPRKPWTQAPDCLTCHTDFGPPETDSAFNVWVVDPSQLYAERKGDVEVVMCASCHGSPHSTYPALENPFGAHRDNMQPMQYTGEAQTIGAAGSCTTCHVEEMDYPAHHPGMGLEE